MTRKQSFVAILLVLAALVAVGLLVRYQSKGHDTVVIPDESVPLSRIEVENIAQALNLYFKEFDEYPHGDASAIAQALGGQNPSKERFIAFPRVNQNGEFLDPWETPYVIAISPEAELQVTSAGPDRVLGNADDRTLQRKLKGIEK